MFWLSAFRKKPLAGKHQLLQHCWTLNSPLDPQAAFLLLTSLATIHFKASRTELKCSCLPSKHVQVPALLWSISVIRALASSNRSSLGSVPSFVRDNWKFVLTKEEEYLPCLLKPFYLHVWIKGSLGKRAGMNLILEPGNYGQKMRWKHSCYQDSLPSFIRWTKFRVVKLELGRWNASRGFLKTSLPSVFYLV